MTKSSLCRSFPRNYSRNQGLGLNISESCSRRFTLTDGSAMNYWVEQSKLNKVSLILHLPCEQSLNRKVKEDFARRVYLISITTHSQSFLNRAQARLGCPACRDFYLSVEIETNDLFHCLLNNMPPCKQNLNPQKRGVNFTSCTVWFPHRNIQKTKHKTTALCQVQKKLKEYRK